MFQIWQLWCINWKSKCIKNSLNKTFDEIQHFNLDFSSSNQNKNQSQNNQNKGTKKIWTTNDTQSILQLKRRE